MLLYKKLEEYSQQFDQLLILGVGLDTKPDILPFLKDKRCFGLDIAVNDIKKIYQYSNTETSTALIECDFNRIHDSNVLIQLAEHGMDFEKKTYLLWEGATFFITANQTYDVLKYLKNNINIIGCSIDFANKDVFSPPRHIKVDLFNKCLENNNTPWKGFFSDNEIKELFDKLDFTHTEIICLGEIEQPIFSQENLDKDVMYFVTSTKIS
ncbi:TPA: class I SAM-dependent methyltransferase [Bacillus cereus]|nr:class I SAM-dependent methyltransferase [Bacillus cereus]